MLICSSWAGISSANNDRLGLMGCSVARLPSARNNNNQVKHMHAHISRVTHKIVLTTFIGISYKAKGKFYPSHFLISFFFYISLWFALNSRQRLWQQFPMALCELRHRDAFNILIPASFLSIRLCLFAPSGDSYVWPLEMSLMQAVVEQLCVAPAPAGTAQRTLE